MKRLNSIIRLSIRGKVARGMAEVAGFGAICYAAWEIHEVMGIAAAGLVLLNYAYGGDE